MTKLVIFFAKRFHRGGHWIRTALAVEPIPYKKAQALAEQ